MCVCASFCRFNALNSNPARTSDDVTKKTEKVCSCKISVKQLGLETLFFFFSFFWVVNVCARVGECARARVRACVRACVCDFTFLFPSNFSKFSKSIRLHLSLKDYVIKEAKRSFFRYKIYFWKAGFRAGRITTEQIFNLRIRYEKYLQHQQDLYHVFIGFKKAFDRLWHAVLWTTMKKYNISANLIRVIKHPYDKATGAVLFNSSTGHWFQLDQLESDRDVYSHPPSSAYSWKRSWQAP